MTRQTQHDRVLRMISALVILAVALTALFRTIEPGRATAAQQTTTPTGENTTSTGEGTPSGDVEGETPPATAAAEETAASDSETEEPAPEETATPAAQDGSPADAGAQTPQAGEAEEREDAAPSSEETATSEPLSDEELVEHGQTIFMDYCSACHQLDGQGVDQAYPALDGNGFVTAEDPSGVVRVIYTGRAGMPHFGQAFSIEEIAAVASYIRTSWSNDASTVSQEQVRTVEEELHSSLESLEHNGTTE